MEAPRKLELKIQITGIAGGGRLPQNAKYICVVIFVILLVLALLCY